LREQPKLKAVVLLALVTCLAGCAAPDGREPYPVVETGSFPTALIPMNEDNQPLWDQPASVGERMAHYRVPGIGVAIIDDFEIVWAGGVGTTRAGGGAPVDESTLFHAGSVAKPVSAAAVIGLVERGALDLDADVNDTLVSWKVPESELTRVEKVTLRRLLSHSAGIEDGLTNRSSSDAIPNYLTPAGSRPTATVEELLEGASGLDVDGPTRVTAVPGSQYRYANADFAILHTGATWGSTSLVWAHPETGQGVVIMTNSATGSMIRFEILLGIALEYGWPLVS
jgi:CubicO group peptidase (beta-lactamase class C family)